LIDKRVDSHCVSAVKLFSHCTLGWISTSARESHPKSHLNISKF